jgi:hypothetical protein
VQPAPLYRQQAAPYPAEFRELLDAALEAQACRIRKDALQIGIASLFVGSVVTLLVTLLVHPIT